jgi:hypothetical protein
LRNPHTVEARIWDLLNAKLERIQAALSSVMEEQEDISQLVIGMAGSSLFNELFSGSEGLSGERLGAWFDRATSTLGGRDVVETVRELLGSVSKFDFQQVGKDLPKVDLPDLERFFTQTVGRHGRRIFRRDDGLDIRTPDDWKARSYALRDKYEGLVFDRSLRGANAASRVLGIGHPLFDVALDDAQEISARAVSVEGLGNPVLILAVEDEVTGSGSLVHRLIFGVTEKDGKIEFLRDWELLQLMNALTVKGPLGAGPATDGAEAVIERFKQAFDASLSSHAPTLRRPISWPEMLFLPIAAG